MHVLRYETPVLDFFNFPGPHIFLAGPTVRGHQQHLQPSWRFAAIELFRKSGFNGTLLVPEFADLTLSDKGREDLPHWEYDGLQIADCIMFWVPRTRELIGLTTNFEFGYWMVMKRDRIIYGRPDDAYRVDYLDILWRKDYEIFGQGTDCIHNTLEKTVGTTLQLLERIPFLDDE